MAPSRLKQTRRILVVAENHTLTEFISGVLTKETKTSAAAQSAERAIHRIETPYFTASVPVWQDEIASPSNWAAEWKAEAGARDVVQAVGSWIVCFTKPLNDAEKTSLRTLLSSVSDVIVHHLQDLSADYAIDALDPTDVVTLAVAVPDPQSAIRNADPAISSLLSTSQAGEAEADLEELCQTATGTNGDGPSWEYVDGTLGRGSGRWNEFGETLGLDRLFEALKGGEWDLGAMDPDDFSADGPDFEDIGGRDGMGPHQRLDDMEDDEFGEFKEPAQPGTTIFEDGFAQDMADGFDDEANKQVKAGAGTTELDVNIDTQTRSITRDVQEGDMKASLLENAQSVARTQPSDEPSSTSIQDEKTTNINGDGDDDPWRLRGKGPAGPIAPDAAAATLTAARTRRNGDKSDDSSDDDDDVQLLQDMMLKLQAARDLGADLPMAQRRQIAAKAVREVMRDL